MKSKKNKNYESTQNLLLPQSQNHETGNCLAPEELDAQEYLDSLSNGMTDNEKVFHEEYYQEFLDETPAE